METKNLTCINCPIGCSLTVEVDENKDLVSIEGNGCKRGEIYARDEVKDPRRMVTSTVKVSGSEYPTASVKTKESIPKNLIFECMKEINKVTLKAPVHIGDIVVKNVCDTGIDVVATQERIN